MKKIIVCLFFCLSLISAAYAAEMSVSVLEKEVKITISECAGEYTCVVLDSAGGTVYTERSDSQELWIPFSDMPDGEYVIRIETESGESFESIFTYLSKDTEQEILMRLKNARGAEEFNAILNENIYFIEACEQYGRYAAFSQGGKERTAVLMIDRHNWSSVVEFQRDFDECVLLAAFNECDTFSDFDIFIGENADMLGLEKYFSLSGSERHKVCIEMKHGKFESLYELREEFDYACDRAKRHSTLKPSGSDGAPRGKFDYYISDINGNKISETPANGTLVRVHIIAAYNNEPEIVYTVGVYDKDERLKQIELFKPSVQTKYYPEFFEFETEFSENNRMKIFSFNNMSDIKPLYDYSSWGLENFETVREEPETEGIIAVRGEIETVTPEYFIINCSEKRMFGYWNGIDRGEKIRVNGQYILDYNRDGAVYNLKCVNGEYTLQSIDSNNLISFSRLQISEYNEKSIKIDNEIYDFAEECEIYLFSGKDKDYCDLQQIFERGEYFTAEMKDGKLVRLNAVLYVYSKVTAAGGGRWCMEDTNEILAADDFDIETDLKIGDILMIYYGSRPFIRKCSGVNAKYCFEEGFDDQGEYYFKERIEIDGRKYEYRSGSSIRIVNGEPCIAYTDPNNQFVKYIEKDMSFYKMLFVTEVNDNSFITPEGTVELGEIVMLNEYIVNREAACAILKEALPCLIYYNTCGEYVHIDIIPYIQMRAKYCGAANSIGDCILDEGTKVMAYSGKGVKLKDNNYYNVRVYKNKDDAVACVLVDSNDGSIFWEYKNMIVSHISDNKVFGYADGEYISFEPDKYFFPGDVICITYENDNILDIKTVFSPLRCDTDYKKNDIVYASAANVKNSIVALYNEVFFVTDETNIYRYDRKENKVIPAELGDIFFGIGYEYNDKLMIERDSGNKIKNMLIVKN